MASSTVLNKSIAPTSILTGAAAVGSALSGVDTDTPTNAVKILDAGSEGARLSSVFVALRNTTVAGRVVLFRGNDASGTTKKVLKSKDLTAWATSTTVGPSSVQAPDFGYSDAVPLILGPNESLWAGVTTAQTGTPVVVHAEGGKYNTP